MGQKIEVDFRKGGHESAAREMTRWQVLRSRVSNALLRLRWKMPYLVWRGDRVWVRVQLTDFGLGGDLSSSYHAEHALKKLGISFDAGTGCTGRDWEWDWSLKGPVQITFRGKP